MTKRIWVLAVAAALLAMAPPVVRASPGDDSASGWMPSRSPPAFDDRKEIRTGAADLRAERFVSAERHFDHVLQDVPANEDATFLRGMARAGHGDLRGARLSFVRSLLLNPDNHFARFELGMTYLRLGQRGLAAEQLAALQRMAATCGRTCRDGPYIGRAILTLGAAVDASGRG